MQMQTEGGLIFCGSPCIHTHAHIVPSNTAPYYFVQWYVFRLKLIIVRHSVQNLTKQVKCYFWDLSNITKYVLQ